jgi:hypothetical protein
MSFLREWLTLPGLKPLPSLGDLYAFKDFTKSFQYSTSAIELAEKTKNYKLKLRAAQKLGVNYYYKGDYTNALKYESVALAGSHIKQG